jgi:2-iminoacetate synthase ThiH
MGEQLAQLNAREPAWLKIGLAIGKLAKSLGTADWGKIATLPEELTAGAEQIEGAIGLTQKAVAAYEETERALTSPA